MTLWRLIVLNIIAAVACAAARPARCNGDTFFTATEIPGKPNYVVFGNVKDQQGNYLKGAVVRVYVAEHMLEFTTQTDVLGRFRTADVGRVINDMGYPVDPSLITVSAEYPGYHIAHREYRGKYQQNKGAVEMDFRMARNGAK
jgi:hypothetical protein